MNGLTVEQFADRMLELLPKLVQELWQRQRGFYSCEELTLPQLRALTYLQAQDTCTMRELARAMRTSESTITGLADRMAKLGLLKRVRSRTDRRVVHVAPTPKGRTILRRIERRRRRAIMLIFRPLKPADRYRHIEAVEKLVAALTRERKG